MDPNPVPVGTSRPIVGDSAATARMRESAEQVRLDGAAGVLIVHLGRTGPPAVRSTGTGGLPPLREVADAYIDHVLASTGGNRSRAARILGVARETLRMRMLTRQAAS